MRLLLALKVPFIRMKSVTKFYVREKAISNGLFIFSFYDKVRKHLLSRLMGSLLF